MKRSTSFLVLFCLFLASSNSERLSQSKSYSNPVIGGQNTPDPGVTQYEGHYYATTTSEDDAMIFPIWKSIDLINWDLVGYIFDNITNKPSWAVQDFWAPEIHQISTSVFNVYFAARDTTGLLCVGVATANNITGPYKDLGAPLVRTPGMGTIDPTYYYNSKTKRRYLYWKEDGNAIGLPTPINVRELGPSGTFFQSGSLPIELFQNTLPWEGPLVEAPWIIEYQNEYYIFYSGNGYAGPLYAVGVAKGPSPIGPFTKYPNPILVTDTNSDWIGPGHCSVLQIGTNSSSLYMIYHAWPPSMKYRNMMVDELIIDSNGPHMKGGQPSYTPQPYPPAISFQDDA